MTGLAALALFLWPQEPAPAQSRSPALQKIDGIAAIVNNEVITESELRARLEPARKSFGYEDPAEWDRFVRETLTGMVRDRLFAQAAKRASLDQQRIEDELEKILKEAERQAGGRSNFLEKLQQMGRTYEDFVKDRRTEIASRNWKYYELGFIPGASGRPTTELYIPPGELEQYYKTHQREFTESEAARGRQIFLTIEDPAEAASARRKAEELRARVEAGEDFAALAKEHSDWKPKEGGDLGWVGRDSSSFERPIVSFLFSSLPGALSPVLPLRAGYAIVKVEARRERRLKPFEEVQLELHDKIWRERHAERLEALWVQLLRDSYVWPSELLPR